MYRFRKSYVNSYWDKFNAVEQPVYNYQYSINQSYTSKPLTPHYQGLWGEPRYEVDWGRYIYTQLADDWYVNQSLSNCVKVGSATFVQSDAQGRSGSTWDFFTGEEFSQYTTLNTTTGLQQCDPAQSYTSTWKGWRWVDSNLKFENAAIGDRIAYTEYCIDDGTKNHRSNVYKNTKFIKITQTYNGQLSSYKIPLHNIQYEPGYWLPFPDSSFVCSDSLSQTYDPFSYQTLVCFLLVKTSGTKVDIYVAGVNNYGVTYSRTPTGETEIVKGSFIETIYATSRNAYPDDDYVGNYWYVYQNQAPGQYIETISTNVDSYPHDGQSGGYYYVYDGADVAYVDQKGDQIGSVTATTRDAYPDNGISNGYWYTYSGTAYTSQYYTTASFLSTYSTTSTIYYSSTKPTINRDSGYYTLSYNGSYSYSNFTDSVINTLLSNGNKYITIGGYSGQTYYYELIPSTKKNSSSQIANILRYYGRNSAVGPITEYGNYTGIKLYNAAFLQEKDLVNQMDVKGNFIEEVEDIARNTYPDDGAKNNYYYVYDRTIGQESIGKGTYITDVYSYSLETYPQDGVMSGYWYVYDSYEVEYYKGEFIEEVYSAYHDYPDNGIAEGYWYYLSSTSTESYPGAFLDFVTNPTRSYYPDNGERNGYWYIYISPIGSDLYTLTSAELISAPIYRQCVNTGSDYNIGDAVCASCEFQFNDPDNLAPRYKKLRFRYYTMQADETSWKLIGIFNTKELTRTNKHVCKIVGYDNVSLFDIYVDDWIENATWPMTLKQTYQSLCTYCGAAFINSDFTNSSFVVKDNFTGINTTGRQILSYIAQASASFIYADPNGIITPRQYINTGITLNNTKYKKAVLADYTTPLINKLTVQMTENDYGVSTGDGDVVYKITNNPLFYAENESEIETAIDRIFAVIKQVSYTPCEIELYQDFNINCGDIVTIDGTVAYIMAKEMNSSGVRLSCVGTETREATGEETNSEIIALRGKTNELTRSLEETQSTITDTAAALQSQITQTANSINATVSAQGQTITQIRQDLNGINMTYNSANGTASITIGNVTVTNLVNGQYVQNVVAGINLNGYVQFNDLSTAGSTTINGANITTGTISASRINLSGSIAWGDLTTACKNTIIEYAEEAAQGAADIPSYIHSTYIDQTNIYSPNIYGAKITAGSTSDGYVQMSSNGMSFKSNAGGSLVGIGYYPGNYSYPYITFGQGVDAYGSDRGMIKKYANGIWIGDSDGIASSSVGSGTGIFIRFTDNTIWKYQNGSATQL